MILNNIAQYIWNTPILLIPESIHGIIWTEIYAKLEYLNPFWSIKDRTALWLLRWYTNDKTVIELSSGNTAKWLGCLANIMGGEVNIVTNRIRLDSMREMMYILWINLEELPPWSECPDPNDPNTPFGIIESRVKNVPSKYFWTAQYRNPENPQIHEDTTGDEILKDLGAIDYFFSGIGTSGSSKGIQTRLNRSGKVDAIGIITHPWSYIPWIRNLDELREVWLFEHKNYREILSIRDQDAIDGMLTLIRKCGMLVWPTTWAVYHGTITYLRSLDSESLRGKKVVFIACDRVEPYTSYIREKRPELFEEKKEEKKESTKLWELKTIIRENITDGKYLLIDMRSYPSYELGHIPGSLSFPFYKLQEYLKDGYLPFPKESPLVFICPFWEESAIMSQIASGLGYESYSLEGWYSNF